MELSLVLNAPITQASQSSIHPHQQGSVKCTAVQISHPIKIPAAIQSWMAWFGDFFCSLGDPGPGCTRSSRCCGRGRGDHTNSCRIAISSVRWFIGCKRCLQSIMETLYRLAPRDGKCVIFLNRWVNNVNVKII